MDAGQHQKVFVLGLDGATFDLILPWVSQGKLPGFAELMQEGSWGKMESVPNQRSAAAWTSFMTGKNPGKHGILEFYEYQPATNDVRFVNTADRSGESLWSILSRNNKKVGVINVPMTFPAEEVNGFLVAGLDAPSVKSKGFTYPASLYETLSQEFGDYILEPGLTGAIVDGRIDEAMSLLKTELQQKMDITYSLMDSHPWDFFMVVLRSLDAVQHTFWKFMDTSHPQYNSKEAAQYGETIFNTYKMIDDFLAELIRSLEKDTTLLLMSDHGFGQKHPASNQLNEWLASKGYLAYNKSSAGASKMLSAVYRGVVGKTPRKLKETLWHTFPALRDKVQTRLCFADVDWSKTLAYSDSLFPNIRINLTGRENRGIVDTADYQEIIDKLVADLHEIVDIQTKEKIVDKVFRRDEIYHGPFVEKAPDLLVRWREDQVIAGIDIDKEGRNARSAPPPVPGEDYRVISGDHRLNGIFLCRGGHICKGKRIEPVNIMDLAPTVLYTMGLPVLEDMDGQVLKDMFDKDFIGEYQVVFENKEDDSRQERSVVYSTEENEEIIERMRSLGYME
jgi:predicted AlkP superfamily phosphohydrolase/phosphomutase